MARDPTSDDDSLLDRRSYLKLAGAATATVAGVGAAGTVAGQSSDLLLAEDFESSDYTDSFTHSYKLGTNDSITSDRSHSGSSALEVALPEGNHYGMDAKFDAGRTGAVDGELDELYVQYYVLFPERFSGGDDGKLPGFGNVSEAGDGGYGGTPATGENGWSARVGWAPSGDGVELASYTYHMDASGSYGDWMTATTIPKGEWVKIDQYVRMNSVDGGANADGQLRMWVDDSLELEETGLRFSSDPSLGPNLWFCVYHGGSGTSPQDQSIYFDGLKASQSEITSSSGGSGGSGDDGGAGDGSGDDGGGDDGGGDDGTTEEPEGTVLELVSADDASNEPYEFTVEGSVTRRITDGDNSAEEGDEIVDNGDGTVTVSDAVGNGFGDSFYVDGTIVSMELSENLWTIRYGGEEVSVAELTGDSSSGSGDDSSSGSGDDSSSGSGDDSSSGSGEDLPNAIVIDGSNRPRAVSEYEFTVSGDLDKSAALGSINEYDAVDGSTATGRIVGGADGYRFSGEVTNFSLDGPAVVRIEDDA